MTRSSCRAFLLEMGKIKIPVQAHFGSKDPKDAEALKQKLEVGGVN